MEYSWCYFLFLLLPAIFVQPNQIPVLKFGYKMHFISGPRKPCRELEASFSNSNPGVCPFVQEWF